jgi:hypothetical protein
MPPPPTDPIAEFHAYDGLSAPASPASVERLVRAFPDAPEDLLALYRDHDGARRAPRRARGALVGRLLPIDEALEVNAIFEETFESEPLPGRVFWGWTDDNGNHAAVFLDGPFKGWVTVLGHDRPEYTPAFRSVRSFLERLLREPDAVDLPGLRRDVPTLWPRAATDGLERELAFDALERCRTAPDDGWRRTWAESFLTLLPASDTQLVAEMLRNPDLCGVEKAIALVELRGYQGCTAELEWLAISGPPNAQAAALRALVRMRSQESAAALQRLERALTGASAGRASIVAGGGRRWVEAGTER